MIASPDAAVAAGVFADVKHAARVLATVDDDTYRKHREAVASGIRVAPDELDRQRQYVQAEDAAAQAIEDASGEPAPVDILRALAAPPLRVEDVPAVVGNYAGVFARAGGFDPSLTIIAAVAVAAAILSDGVRLCVSGRSGWFESARLWAAVLGSPGAGKTPTQKAMAKPLTDLHRELVGQWVTETKGVDEAERPACPALYTSDATTEALADVLRGNERGILYLVDELESWLASHDAYRSGQGRDRGEWLRLYDGGPHQVNRVRRGAMFVPNWGASLLSATTPAALRKLATKLPDDGLLQRLILVVARPRGREDGSVYRATVEDARASYEARLRALYAMPDGVVQLSAAAREKFSAECDELQRLTVATDDVHPSYAAHLAKRGAMLARVALVFHALESDGAEISGPTMELAARFMRRQERHAWAVYSDILGAGTGMELARAIARTILAAPLYSFGRRELAHGNKAFRAAAEPERLAALQMLDDAGWITCSTHPAAHGATWTVDLRVHRLFAREAEQARKQRELVRRRLFGEEANAGGDD